MSDYKAVLIDDDILVRDSWLMRAKRAGVSLATFESIDEFKSILSSLPKTLPIFIDSNLGQGIKGEDFAKQLFEAGFTDLYLATGYPVSYFKPMSWLKGIVSKDPPDWLFK